MKKRSECATTIHRMDSCEKQQQCRTATATAKIGHLVGASRECAAQCSTFIFKTENNIYVSTSSSLCRAQQFSFQPKLYARREHVWAPASPRMRKPAKGIQEIDTRPRIGKFTRTQYQRRARSTRSAERERATSTKQHPNRRRVKEGQKKQNCSKKLISFVAQCERESRQTVENLLFSFQFFCFHGGHRQQWIATTSTTANTRPLLTPVSRLFFRLTSQCFKFRRNVCVGRVVAEYVPSKKEESKENWKWSCRLRRNFRKIDDIDDDNDDEDQFE